MENVPSIISHNPYHVLGVFTNTHVKERIANANRIKAYAKVGKSVTLPNDINYNLPPVGRTEDVVTKALSQLTLPQNQLKFALFWFVNSDPFDDISLKYFTNGNVGKAKEIMSKRRTFSTLINLGVLAFIESDNAKGVSCIYSVISNTSFREAFVKAICGDDFKISVDELTNLFNEALSEFMSPQVLLNLYKGIDGASSVVSNLEGRVAAQYEQQIDAEVLKAKHVDTKDSTASYNAGIYLQNATSTHLHSLLQLLGKDNLAYQRYADKVALQVLQCSISYYNNTTESKAQASSKALDLASYASTIAVGTLAKERIKKNIGLLNNMKAEAEVEDDLNFITIE